MSQYFLRMPWYLARTKLPMQKPLGNFFHSPLLHGMMTTWLRCTKWAWQVHDDASWCSSLLPTHLLKWIPSPNDKEERFDTYGTYHPCQSWRFKEHHPNDLISLWWLIHLIFLSRKWNIKIMGFLEWCDHAVNKWIDHPCTTSVLWLSMNWDLGSKSDAISLSPSMNHHRSSHYRLQWHDSNELSWKKYTTNCII